MPQKAPPAARERPSSPRPDDDEALDELPPMDGDDGDAAAADELDEELDTLGEDASLDDAELGGDPLEELSVSGDEAGWLDDASEADMLDVGDAAAAFGREGERVLEDLEEPGAGEGDYDLLPGAEREELDHGEEGPDTDDEDLDERELPRLDADDEGEGEALAFGDPFVAPAEDVRPPWDDRAWQRAIAPLRVGALRTVTRLPGGALAGGRVLAAVDEAGRCSVLRAAGLRGGVAAAAAAPGVLAVATDEGAVLVSRDGGATFVDRSGWRDVVPATERRSLSGLAVVGDMLVVLSRTGRLLAGRDHGARWEELARGARFVALTVSEEGGVAALHAPLATGAVSLARVDAAGVVTASLPPLPRGLRVDVGALLAVAGEAVALLAEDVGVYLREGPVWSRVEGTGPATAIALADGGRRLLCALHDPDEERSFLLRADAPAEARIVAEVGSDQEDPEGTGRVHALVWDEAARLAWLAGTFGLVAFRPS